MQLITDPAALPAGLRGATLALGNFDGVHRGHRALIAAAQLAGGPAGVLTFEPHPRRLFRPDDPAFRLTPEPVKRRILAETGIDLLVQLRFDRGFSLRSADSFTDEILAGLGIAGIICGGDFHYGHDRGGNLDHLRAAGARLGFSVTVHPPVKDKTGMAVSSSRIRAALMAGDARQAAEMLGRPWSIEGAVEHGDKRGRELGYPTANIPLGRYLTPALGIYAVRCRIDRAEGWHDGVANLGIRPMFEIKTPLLEAHLFDFDGDLYGKTVEVRLIDRLRGEAKFDSLEALIAQMDQDSAAARAALSA